VRNINFERQSDIQQALQYYQSGFDFADALHHAGATGCKALATFEQKFKSWLPRQNENAENCRPKDKKVRVLGSSNPDLALHPGFYAKNCHAVGWRRARTPARVLGFVARQPTNWSCCKRKCSN
jgi:hypothetical protein